MDDFNLHQFAFKFSQNLFIKICQRKEKTIQFLDRIATFEFFQIDIFTAGLENHIKNTHTKMIISDLQMMQRHPKYTWYMGCRKQQADRIHSHHKEANPLRIFPPQIFRCPPKKFEKMNHNVYYVNQVFSMYISTCNILYPHVNPLLCRNDIGICVPDQLM